MTSCWWHKPCTNRSFIRELRFKTIRNDKRWTSRKEMKCFPSVYDCSAVMKGVCQNILIFVIILSLDSALILLDSHSKLISNAAHSVSATFHGHNMKTDHINYCNANRRRRERKPQIVLIKRSKHKWMNTILNRPIRNE